ncbi:unnamed protein product [Cuscuta europaea]|uniref:Uncharacterized protein n=1 Tax=Cuscuta europaea TaxID=41803 RepID=A0A9P1EGK1_CUSEU|nr:unnamed protein product [Cuscuta europaea]
MAKKNQTYGQPSQPRFTRSTASRFEVLNSIDEDFPALAATKMKPAILETPASAMISPAGQDISEFSSAQTYTITAGNNVVINPNAESILNEGVITAIQGGKIGSSNHSCYTRCCKTSCRTVPFWK